MGERGDELHEHLTTAEGRLRASREAKRALEEETRAKGKAEQEERKRCARAEGKAYRPRKDPSQAKSRGRAQRNFTDPDSRIMKSSDRAFIQGYNAQAAVDTER